MTVTQLLPASSLQQFPCMEMFNLHKSMLGGIINILLLPCCLHAVLVASIRCEIWGFVDLGEKNSNFSRQKFKKIPNFQNFSKYSLLEAKIYDDFLVIDSKNILLCLKFQRNYVYSLYSTYFCTI